MFEQIESPSDLEGAYLDSHAMKLIREETTKVHELLNKFNEQDIDQKMLLTIQLYFGETYAIFNKCRNISVQTYPVLIKLLDQFLIEPTDQLKTEISLLATMYITNYRSIIVIWRQLTTLYTKINEKNSL